MTFSGQSTPELILLARDENTSSDEAMARGIEFHNLAVRGEKAATEAAIQWLGKAQELRPGDPEAQAYYGSALALLGRDSTDPEERFAKALQGTKLLDRVVKSHDHHLTIRIIRGYVNYRLPELYFHRTHVAIEDFLFLIAQYEKDNSVFAEEFYWRLLFDLGKAHMNMGDEQAARAVWRRLAGLRPNQALQRRLRVEGMEIEGYTEDSEEMGERNALMEEGKRFLRLGETGDTVAAKQAHVILSEARHTWLEDPLIAALYGSSLSLMGRYASEGGSMFSHAIQAITIIEEALRQDPDCVELRRIRAAHSYRLPEAFFFRTTTAITDFAYLISQYEAGNQAIDREEYRELLYHLGDCYLRLGMRGDAKHTWDRLLTLDPDSPYSQSIEDKLREPVPKEPVVLAEINGVSDLLKLGISLHNQALGDDPLAAEEARACLEKAHRLDAKDPLIEAYYGSAVALTGRYARNSSTMFANAVQGLMLINNALRRRPKNPRIRLLRGYLCYSLPEPLFHLTATAIEDFEFVRQWYQSSRTSKKKTEVIPPEEFAGILPDLQIAYRRMGKDSQADALDEEIRAYAVCCKTK